MRAKSSMDSLETPAAAESERRETDRPLGARRVRTAKWLAFVALVAACIAAVGPAERIRTTYSWPPASLPSGSPSTTWYSPLLLVSQEPDALIAEIPCDPAPPLAGAGRVVTVLATSRAPERNNGFAVTQANEELTFEVGGSELARVPVKRAPSGGECSHRVEFRDGTWSLTGGRTSMRSVADLGYMPVVTGLFSQLDLRRGPRPTASVTTAAHATSTTTRQTIAWLVAALASIAALCLVSSAAPRGTWATPRSVAGRVFRSAGAVDAVVGVWLVVWWVLSPAFFDDGWVIVRQRVFETNRGFTEYYSGLGNNLPNGYWLEWLQHWVTQSYETLLVLRIPALLCLAVIWVLCRWTFSRITRDATGSRGLATWVMASVFVAGAMAWGMTLRPEPVTAVLATAALASAVRFDERRTAGPVALFAVLVPLAVTGHHAGVVTLAPVIVIAPALFSWARREFQSSIAIVTAALALLLMLVFLGSDVSQRADDAQAIRTYGGLGETWRDEATRYDLLSVTVFANPLRRGWVALIALVVLAFLLRRRSRRTDLDLPAASLGVALVLLIVTPSKWPWHFGTLIGIGAVAIAAETMRLRRDAEETPGWSARPFVVVVAALLALVWAVGHARPWNPVDLRTLDWTTSNDGFFGKAVAASLVLLVVGVVAATRLRHKPLSAVPWALATSAGLIITLPVIGFSARTLALDAARTDGWTLTRQNLQSLWGAAGCGLADELLVPSIESARAVSTPAGRHAVAAWLPALPVERVPRHILSTNASGVSDASPWYRVVDQPTGLFVSGQATPLALEWGSARNGAIEPLGRDPIAPVVVPTQSEAYLPWTFLLSTELPQPPADANVVRIVVDDPKAAPSTVVGVSAPVTYDATRLSGRLDDGSATLVHPTTVTYFPCARQPAMANGIVEAPTQIITDVDVSNPVLVVGSVGPFVGVLDLYRLDRLALTDSGNPPPERIAYGVDKRLPGGIEAPPESTTEAS
jgi:hypothetical protein